jgi:hypothetical protein
MGPAMGSYAMMGGGYGHNGYNGSYDHMTRAGEYRTTHVERYTMGFSYSGPTDHMNTQEMNSFHYNRYPHDPNRTGYRLYHNTPQVYNHNGQRNYHRYEQGDYHGK